MERGSGRNRLAPAEAAELAGAGAEEGALAGGEAAEAVLLVVVAAAEVETGG